MINVLHISTECYPMAKAGGMGDVVGALPYYSLEYDVASSVIIPKYGLSWFEGKRFDSIEKGQFAMGSETIRFTIEKWIDSDLPYDIYFVNIPGKFDRPSIYLNSQGKGFIDEVERNLSFQTCVLEWLNQRKQKFDLLHCHDHMTGLIPFLLKYGDRYESLADIPSFYTIHNAAYTGMMDWRYKDMLPSYKETKAGLLDWDGHIHSMASAIRCCWKLSTVSPSYLEEIQHGEDHLSRLLRHENEKSVGILNGIDENAWNPKIDHFIAFRFKSTWDNFKERNKSVLCDAYNLDKSLPLYCFIGRLAHQKGADILIQAIEILLHGRKARANFIILGSGELALESALNAVALAHSENVRSLIKYDEKLSHQLYAGSDFLIMPSRFEPCGLNQMFAMRYGTIPIVRATGGLIDSVRDISQDGTGICFDSVLPKVLAKAINRGIAVFRSQKEFKQIRQKAGRQNFSWKRSMKRYAEEYYKLINI